MSEPHEDIKTQLAAIWELSAHLTAAEKADLAASLDSFPQRVFSGMTGWGLYQHREILKGRLIGQPSQWEVLLTRQGRDIEAMLRGEHVFFSPQGQKGTR